MAYSKSIRAFHKVRDVLEEMLTSEEMELEWETSSYEDASRLAYQIHDGINWAVEHQLNEDGSEREPFHQFASLKSKFILRIRGKHVIATRTKKSTTVEYRRVVRAAQVKESLSHMVLSNVVGTIGLVSAVVKHQANSMFFPACNPNNVVLDQIFSYTSSAGYFIRVQNDGILITREPIEDAWSPVSHESTL